MQTENPGGAVAESTYDGLSATTLTLAPFTVTTTAMSCSVTSGAALSFDFGDMQYSRLGGPGVQTDAAFRQDKKITLNCDSGAGVIVTLTGNKNAQAGDDTVLALSPGTDSTTGLGVQILSGAGSTADTLLNYDSSNSIKIDVPNSAPGGKVPLTLPVAVRYYRTQESVSGGSANAIATLNLTYQ
jgi:Fimbrial protein.